MDDRAALIARRVAVAAAAWFNAPVDVDAYRRLVAAVGEWNAYSSPQLQNVDDELLDGLADLAPPVPLVEGLADLESVLRRQTRRQLQLPDLVLSTRSEPERRARLPSTLVATVGRCR